jgi:hypothetical protein
MKSEALIGLVMAGVLMLSVAGCKKEEAAATINEGSNANPDNTAAVLKEATAIAIANAEKSMAEAKKEAEAAKDAVPATAILVNEKIENILEKAQVLMDEGKPQEALSALNELTGMTLSGAQQKMADALKEQIQKALATKAAEASSSAVGNLLKH